MTHCQHVANSWPTVHLVGTTQHPGVWLRSPWDPKASKASTPLYLNILTNITTDLASVCAVPISKYERSGEKRHAPSSKRAALILVKIRPSGHFLRDLRPHPRLRDDSREWLPAERSKRTCGLHGGDGAFTGYPWDRRDDDMSLPPIRIFHDRFATRAVLRYSSRENAIAREGRQRFEISTRDAPSRHNVVKRSGAEVKSWHCSPRPNRTVVQCQQLPTLTSKTIGPLPGRRRLDPTERISGRFWVAKWCGAE